MTNSLGLLFDQQDVLNGLVTGVVYAAFAIGFVLVYRSSRVFNFAHGEVGAFSLVVFAILHVNAGLPWFVAAVIAVAGGAGVGALTQATILRRFSESSEVTLLVATIGIGTALAALRLQLPTITTPGPLAAAFDMRWALGDGLVILGRDVAVLTILPIVLLAVGLVITQTPLGLYIRAVASDPDTAAQLGLRVNLIRGTVWAFAGGLAAVTMVVAAPLDNTSAAQVASLGIGPPLLVRAFAITSFVGDRSLRAVVALSVGLGLAEEVLRANVSSQGAVDALLFVAIVAAIAVNKAGRSEQFTSWGVGRRVGLLSGRTATNRLHELALAAATIALVVVFPLAFSAPSTMLTATNVAVFAMAAASVTVLTGWGGYLSFAQFTLVGVGAMTTAALTNGHPLSLPFGVSGTASFELPWAVAAGLAIAAGTSLALLLSLVASRYQRRLLAVATLAFSVAGSSWMFGLDFFSNGSRSTAAPAAPVLDWLWLEIDFGASRRVYFWLVAACVGGVLLTLRAVRGRPLGNAIIASSENPQLLASCGYSPRRSQLHAFGLSGAIASLAGVLFATAQPSLAPTTMFGTRASISVVAATVIGGLGHIAGPILGALWVRGLSAAWENDWIRFVTSDIGLLLVLLYRPQGLATVGLRQRKGGAPDTKDETSAPPLGITTGRRATLSSNDEPKRAFARLERSPVLLDASNLSVSFGDFTAVKSVSVHVGRNEVVGIIGTNGAGKTTLLNAISGFVPSTGSVQLNGALLDGTSAAARHAQGLGRTFQSQATRSILTTSEWLSLAAHSSNSSGHTPTGALEALGIADLAHRSFAQIDVIGQRHVDLARTLVLGSQILLLDEPTAGLSLAQKSAYVEAVLTTRSLLNAGVLIVEHDVALMSELCDRLYYFDAGIAVATGTPESVLNNSAVRSRYLGHDVGG